MNKFLRTLMLLSVVFGCAAVGFAQIRTGGYKKVPVNDAGVVAAAEFAVNAQIEIANTGIDLVTVQTAERQTVAGTNYKLCLQVDIPDENTGEPTEQFVSAIIFQSLKKDYSLKSWTEVEGCGENQ